MSCQERQNDDVCACEIMFMKPEDFIESLLAMTAIYSPDSIGHRRQSQWNRRIIPPISWFSGTPMPVFPQINGSVLYSCSTVCYNIKLLYVVNRF
jgi:hypothetical protein